MGGYLDSISGDGRSSTEINAREGQFYLATIHRQENSDIEDRLREIIDALSELDLPTYIPSHPRLIKRCKEFDIEIKIKRHNEKVKVNYIDLFI